MKIPDKIKHFEKIKSQLKEEHESHISFFKYYEENWIFGKRFSINNWDYHQAIQNENSGVNFKTKFHFTNNAAESCNSIINSLLNRGYLL